jgi:predicted regulator of Ras-like GTPase activity (Roadblock/LC7/MglB family)
MKDIVLTIPMLEKSRSEIEKSLINAGAHTVLLVDHAGNIVVNCGKTLQNIDIVSLAALAAANFAATSEIAKLIGEEDFTLLFHKGKRDSIHFARVGDEFIIVTIFGEDISLGVIRLRIAELTGSLTKILKMK